MIRSLCSFALLAAACGPTPATTASATDDPSTSAGTSVSEGTGGEPTTAGGTTDPTTSTTSEPGTDGATTVGTTTAATTSGTTADGGTAVAETTAAETTVAETTAAETTAAETTVAETTAAETTAAETTAAETTAAETTGGIVCEDPDPEPVLAEWSFTFPDGEPHESVSAECTVTTFAEVGPDVVLTLACALDGELIVEFKYTRAPDAPPPLTKGAKLTLEYREEPIFWINRWFSISGAGFPSMNFGGISADHLAPPGTTTESFFATGLDVIGGVCSPIDGDQCGPEERLALDVAFGVESRVLDGQFRSFFDLPGYVSLWVQTARRPVEPVQCDDVPPAWFQLLMTSEFGP